MSLVDTGMVPFIDAYPMVISLGLLIMAGNMLMVSVAHAAYHHCHQPNQNPACLSPVFCVRLPHGVYALR